MAHILAGLAEIEGTVRMYKKDIAGAVLDRQWEEEKEWIDNVYIKRLMMLRQRKGAGGKSERSGRKCIMNEQHW